MDHERQKPELTGKKSRRSFLNVILGSSLFGFFTALIYPIGKFLIPPRDSGEATPNSIIAGKLDELNPDSFKIIKFGRQPVILIRIDTGELRAFSSICTHLDCIVKYRSDFKHIWCACHNGHYDLNGINIAGPPPRPLATFKVYVSAGKIFISKEPSSV